MNIVTTGAVSITGITEYQGPTHQPGSTFAPFDAARFAEIVGNLPPASYLPPMDRLIFAVQIWVVRTRHRVIIIDTGVGNQKARLSDRLNMLNSLTLPWLEAAGAGREAVTDVVMTHLHPDHVGWNTVLEDGVWKPTFPNARYWAPAEDLAHFEAEYAASEAPLFSSFGDSVLPILQAGLLRSYQPGETVAGVLQAQAARGHTPGMCSLWLRHEQFEAVFCADIVSSPVQIFEPSWNSSFCQLEDDARRSRDSLLRQLRADTLVLPCHFPDIGCGFVVPQADGYRWQPLQHPINV